VRKAVDLAVQIAHGLETAHAQGIVHRDLKPENLFITTNGRVKILDFGLAKLSDSALPAELANVSTRTSVTAPGTLLGTVAYMSPEQLRGLPADQRSDLFAFGAILYEILSGTGAFQGATAADTMSAILKEAPPPLPVDRDVPVALDRIVDRCLEKLPAARFQSAGDLAFALQGLPVGADSEKRSSAVRRARSESIAWITAGVFAVAAIALAIVIFRPRPLADSPVFRSSILPPEHVTFFTASPAGGLALSPDGRRLVFTAQGPDGRVMLWLRALDGLTTQPLTGTEGAFYPFWSPNSNTIGFFAGGTLKKIDIAGGSPVVLCETPKPSILAAGGSWNRDDVILFAQATAPIYRVSALGGTPVPATTLDERAGETQHWAPFFLPDGRHFLYFAAGSKSGGPDEPNGVYAASLDSSARKLLFPGGSNAKYAAGQLIFPRERTLVAQAFDPRQLKLSGDAVPIADQIAVGGLSGRTGAFSVSETGVLAYQAASGEVHSRLVWFDHAGNQIGTVGNQADYGDLELSPDREQAAVSVLDPAKRTRDVYVVDVSRGVRTRFTVDPTDEQTSIWSPDGTQLLFNARPKGYFDLYERDASGVTNEQVLLADTRNKTPVSWSPDGKFVLYSTGAFVVGNSDLWLLPMEASQKPTPFLQTPFNETYGRFSPDGRWVAYVSNETGSSELYVTHFPGPKGKWPISTDGGNYPRWRADGRELFYVARDGTLMAAAVNGQGQEFEVGGVRPLFGLRTNAGGRYPYDVSADGQRFLVNTIVETTTQPPITLVVNWASALRTP
jgi:Tol biopolymer transport system component